MLSHLHSHLLDVVRFNHHYLIFLVTKSIIVCSCLKFFFIKFKQYYCFPTNKNKEFINIITCLLLPIVHVSYYNFVFTTFGSSQCSSRQCSIDFKTVCSPLLHSDKHLNFPFTCTPSKLKYLYSITEINSSVFCLQSKK